jgi:hypothetical protein
MTTPEVIMLIALPGVVLVSVWLGRHQRQHRHIWTPWSCVWKEDLSAPTEIQERTCKGCGFRERHDPADEQCPPHRWSKWEETSIVVNDKDQEVGQGRTCLKCGLRQLRRVGDRDK